jgi:hypothetical protein
MELIVGFERLGVEQRSAHLSSLRSYYGCRGFARVAKNRSFASLPCRMAVDKSRVPAWQAGRQSFEPILFQWVLHVRVPRYLEKWVSARGQFRVSY